MTRIAVAHPHFAYPGGASLAVLETMQRLALGGDEVHIISLIHPDELEQRYDLLQFHDLGGPLSSELRYWLSLVALQRRFSRIVDALEPDVVVASVFPANYWAFLYRVRRPQLPCVWFCQEPSAFVHDRQVINGVPWPMRAAVLAANPPLQVMDRWLVRFADSVIVNSRYSADRVRRVYNRSSTPVRLGVNTDRFTSSTSKERMVLTVARLTRFKRVDILIRAAAILWHCGYRDVQWIVAGDGEEAAALRQLAADLGVADQIEFVGRLTEQALIELYSRAAIVAVTAVGEPFGLVPIEAMAAGAAVVCSDSGGPAETVQDGLTGFHFRSGDADDCARKIAKLLDDMPLASAMGRSGRQRIAETYTWEHTAHAVKQVLDTMLTAHRDCRRSVSGRPHPPC